MKHLLLLSQHYVKAKRTSTSWIGTVAFWYSHQNTFLSVWQGLAPLHLAAIHCRLSCLRFLLEDLRLDVNLASSVGWRPVHLVISADAGKKSLQCLQYLLQRGADPSV